MDKEIALVQSKTFWGALLAMVAIVANAMGWQSIAAWAVDPSSQPHIMEFVTDMLNVIAVAGTLLAMIGRFVASSKVTSLLPKGSSSAAPTAGALVAIALLGLMALSLSACMTTQQGAELFCVVSQDGVVLATDLTSGGAHDTATKPANAQPVACAMGTSIGTILATKAQ